MSLAPMASDASYNILLPVGELLELSRLPLPLCCDQVGNRGEVEGRGRLRRPYDTVSRRTSAVWGFPHRLSGFLGLSTCCCGMKTK